MAQRTVIALLLVVFLSVLFVLPAHGAKAARPGNHPYVPGEVILKFRDGASAPAAARVRSGLAGSMVKQLGRTGAELRRLGGLGVDEALARYGSDPAVAYIEPNYIVHADAIPNDPSFNQLWALQNTGQNGGTPGADMDATLAWDLFTGSHGILVGVIDSGIDMGHPDLAANIWTNPGEIAADGKDNDGNGYVDDIHGWDFRNHDNDASDDNGHGTHCAGIIGAVGDNTIGVTGVNWAVGLVPLKFLDATGSGTIADAILAIDYATSIGCRLTSNSWGGGGYSQALRDAIDAADAAGVLFVASAGGSGSDIDISPYYPASYASSNIVAVEGTDENDALGAYSGYGAESVDLAAPGSDILSTYPGNTYAVMTGTSAAAAQVSGALAFVFGKFPGIGHMDAKTRLLSMVDHVSGLAGTCYSGGRVNLYSSVMVASVGAEGAPPAVPRLYQNVPNPVWGAARIAFDLARDGRVVIQVVDPAGRLVRTLTDAVFPAGRHEVVWDGRGKHGGRTSAGIYLYRLRTPGYTATRKLALLP